MACLSPPRVCGWRVIIPISLVGTLRDETNLFGGPCHPSNLGLFVVSLLRSMIEKGPKGWAVKTGNRRNYISCNKYLCKLRVGDKLATQSMCTEDFPEENPLGPGPGDPATSLICSLAF